MDAGAGDQIAKPGPGRYVTGSPAATAESKSAYSGNMSGCSSQFSLLRRGRFVVLSGLLMAGWPVVARAGVAQSGAAPAVNETGSGNGSSVAQSTPAKPATTPEPATKHVPPHQTSRASSVPSRASRVAHTTRIKQAFVASKELEPMAQQLANLRTPEAYAAVTGFAHSHTGEAATAAYLALGHAYLLDKRYADAETALAEARRGDGELGDYADFLDAEASHAAGDDAAAENILRGFTGRYPDSIFDAQEPELEATVLLALGNNAAARQVLAAAAGTGAAGRPGFELAEGQVELALGQQQAAETTFRLLLLGHPLSAEAQTARAKLTQLGAETLLTTADLRTLAEAYYNAGRYDEADEQFRVLKRAPGLDEQTRNGFAVAEAACALKLKRLTEAEAQALPDTEDENGARRLDLLLELARDRNDTDGLKRIIGEMENRFPHSAWLADALFSAANMYMLKRDYPTAIEYYGDLATRFPSDKNAS
jgi:peptidoglycan lytic transglycosylase